MTQDVIMTGYTAHSKFGTGYSEEEVAMQYGLSLPNGGVCGDARVLAELGCLAEEAGWDGVFVEDYIVHQSDGAAPTMEGGSRGGGPGSIVERALYSGGRFRRCR